MILLGLATIGASLLLRGEWSPVSTIVLRRSGDIIAFSALSWVVSHAVYAPGRITSHRLQGAVVLYLTIATIFASAFGLIWELNPGAFVNLVARAGPEEVASMLYFSLTTLTTTGYGDIVAVDPFARSLAFSYVAEYLYEGDSPLAERKAQALTLDRDLLRELLGDESLRDLFPAIPRPQAPPGRTAESKADVA